MKHPHCNRSLAGHLFWCRGFAPVFFILAVALIVVAIGSGVYFARDKHVAQAPGSQGAVATSSQAIPVVATSSVPVNATTSAPVGTLPKAVTAPIIKTTVDCGANQKTTSQCLTQHIATCTLARGVVVDPGSGMTVERIIDGYKRNKCSYRTNIISGKGEFALLVGMNINCMLPKSVLATTAKGGAMSQTDMLTYCTGSFIDLMRAQLNTPGQ